MKKVLISFILATSLLTSCAGWNNKDKTLLTTYAITSGIDAYQTSKLDGVNRHEINPLFANDNGTAAMNKVILLKLLGFGLVYNITNKNEKYRSSLLWIANSIQGGVIVWNFK